MLQFDPIALPESSIALREEVRAFLALHAHHLSHPNSDFSTGHDPEFSARLGERGWIGMTWPTEYGGGGRSFFDRYVVTEELLAAGAPVSAHWIADRQSGPLLLRFGTEAQRCTYLPGITRGESYFSIGMSEPNTGSDLASVRTTARRSGDGWLINGTKLWSTDAQRNHYLIALVRTEPPSENRHAGLSQIIVDLKRDGAVVRPIRNMAGGEDFNEIQFDDVLVPEDRIVGEPGNGWRQVTSELAYERSGPERFLSALRVLVEFVRAVGPAPDAAQAAAIGRAVSHLLALRRMSISVAGMLEEGKSPDVEAALVKALGNDFEKLLPEMLRQAAPALLTDQPEWRTFRETFTDTLLLSPSFTIRGGTREILRGVIARGLGLR
ncbi:MAG: acyl-CoA dehydrogenase family protein [Pseudomonadales bacterium]|nr:acyl-CoA dehydrogenase family protein [Pseudomonadales bacterium]